MRPDCDTPCCETPGTPGLWGADVCGCACHAPEGYQPTPYTPTPALGPAEVADVCARVTKFTSDPATWRCAVCGKAGVLMCDEGAH
jgi:hypothetical protein